MSNDVMKFEEAEWAEIELLPVAVFYYVANADDQVADVEITTFRETWGPNAVAEKYSDDKYFDMFMKEMFKRATGNEYSKLLDVVKGYSKPDFKRLFVKVRRLLEKLSPEESNAILTQIVLLAKEVSESHRQHVRKVSKKEQQAIADIQLYLQQKN